MIHKSSVLNIAVILIISACANNKQKDKSSFEKSEPHQEQVALDSNIIRVYVEQDGKLLANEIEISLSDLDSSFSKLKGNGIVYYSRDNGQGNPPEESMKVMELIVKYNLPVKLFTDKTFTVIVNPN
jgi:biopolymer transport protein ExbD